MTSATRPRPFTLAKAIPRVQSRIELTGYVAVLGVLGLALIAVAFGLGRADHHLNRAELLSWAGLALIVAPAALALLARGRPRSERVLILVIATLLLYGVKVVHDPTGFAYGDEYVHAADTRNILSSGGLFTPNPILPIIPSYPGVSLVTAAVSSVTHLGIFPSGLIVIGTARLLMVLALFLIFEAVTGSSRVAALGGLAYASGPNYLYWTAQFSYESLSLPLMTAIIAVVLARDRAPGQDRMRWTVPAVLLIAALVATHHLTAYLLAAVLWGISILVWTRRWTRPAPPVDLAILTTGAAAAWALLVAGTTTGYLGGIFTAAFKSAQETLSSGTVGRTPFQSADPGAVVTPPWDRALAVGALLLTAVGVVGGLLALRRRLRPDAIVVLLALAAPAYLAFYLARAAPGAWETANRSSEFLCVGVALVLAVAAVAALRRARGAVWARAGLAAALVVLVAGGSVIGWPQSVRLPRAYDVATPDGTIVPQGAAAADFAAVALPRRRGLLADTASGRQLLQVGFSHLLVGRAPGAHDMFELPTLPTWQRRLLARRHISYVVFDRRTLSGDGLIGYFFPRQEDPPSFYPASTLGKFQTLQVPVVFSSGDIHVYDMRHLYRRVPPPRR